MQIFTFSYGLSIIQSRLAL